MKNRPIRVRAALAIAEETEEQLRQERKRYEQELAELQKQVAETSKEERQSVIRYAQQQAEEIDLDEVAIRLIIDLQLLEAGLEPITIIFVTSKDSSR
ncbi:hypothetical protein [uncultured Rubinisphaera sp.]|uniref:hypothetical protein n=1 Tax=uncultured Rubinisphaera sp. TaxID=1678686 RepID=UPI0030DA879F